ncbi:MAG: VanZ family protein [Planctomycetaceae bacterium]|nr:VanZ family protein [Planctomycetaceae bacterium]
MVDVTRDNDKDVGRFTEVAASTRDSEATRLQAQTLRRFVGLMLGIYWFTLFLATHIPIRESPASIPGGDKAVHFVAYAILAMLLTFFVGLRRALTFKVAAILVAGIATYGAIDEWLQIPVGRTCDIADWAFDVAGAIIGVLLIMLITKWHGPRERAAASPFQGKGGESRTTPDP